jgi:hypothetical protein
MIRQRNLKDMDKDEILKMINQLTHEQNIKNQLNNHTISHPPPPTKLTTTTTQPTTHRIFNSPSGLPSIIPTPSNSIPTKQISPTPSGYQQISPTPAGSQQINPTPSGSQPVKGISPTLFGVSKGGLELFLDDVMIEKLINVGKRVHEPVPGDIAITFDKPWEGNISAYYTIIREDEIGLLRLYYRAGNLDLNSLKMGKSVGNGQRTCYAESRDGGTSWIKPSLNLFEYPLGSGNMQNNIIWIDERSTENFTPFKDTNVGVAPDMLYKAIGSRLNPYFLYAMASADGIHWRMIREEPILTIYHGKFDTQNVVFFNQQIGKYMMFYRDCLDRITNVGRGIKVAISDNFINWSLFKWLNWTSDQFPQEEYQLYTNSIQPYYRAPHILIGFPNRFNQPRIGQAGHPQTGVFDSVLISSRDGLNWSRTSEAIFRPGPIKKRWVSRNNLMALNLFPSTSKLDPTIPEISMLSSEGYYLDLCSLRKYSWRLDGFISIHAGFQQGELITKPLKISGRILVLNLSTSAMGWVKVEILDSVSKVPLPGYELNNCHEIFGDSTSLLVTWNMIKEEVDPDADRDDKVNIIREGYDLSDLSGKSIQLRFRMKDCDLYSYQFVDK